MNPFFRVGPGHLIDIEWERACKKQSFGPKAAFWP